MNIIGYIVLAVAIASVIIWWVKTTSDYEAKFKIAVDAKGVPEVYSLAFFIKNMRQEFVTDLTNPEESRISNPTAYQARLGQAASALTLSAGAVDRAIRADNGEVLAAALLLAESLKAVAEVKKHTNP
ncbi:hypothetical protein HOU02_gp278 [Caulobacter phage CcrBL9]|uniref:Uncharacterized protein n=1 Tax=Caulobacter phage CcrBL9 TaxID=2283270 RepID=A0A385EF80_9CAUD|nr:hypothetical protein HOU02_gp278 [Caulobacter phage CcrBL9]AXQ69447.1 hypothetical protein CcrBL9_gp423 [Caulobacter phage CcrBL9]